MTIERHERVKTEAPLVEQCGRVVTMPQTAQADLRHASEIMRQRGLCWGAHTDDAGHVCSRAALLLAICEHPTPWFDVQRDAPTQMRVRTAEQVYRAVNGASTIRYHDARVGKHAECVAAMERAADGVIPWQE